MPSKNDESQGNGIKVVKAIKAKFEQTGSPAMIPLQKGGTFTAEITTEGLLVDNLGKQPFLPWLVFQEAICVLVRNGGRASRGNAMISRLGQEELSLDSVEGHIAHVVYGKQVGDSVFRRISPISAILVWAGLCDTKSGELLLR